jgi:hypothetical protein
MIQVVEHSGSQFKAHTINQSISKLISTFKNPVIPTSSPPTPKKIYISRVSSKWKDLITSSNVSRHWSKGGPLAWGTFFPILPDLLQSFMSLAWSLRRLRAVWPSNLPALLLIIFSAIL